MAMKRRIAWLVLAVSVLAAAGWISAVSAQEEPEPALEEFVPTERLPSDSAISFPVDI